MRKPTGADPRKRKGLIIVHTGEGKGKSTAAFGLAMRAAGNKMNVFIMQFMKGPWKAGERKAFESLAPYVEVVPMERPHVLKDQGQSSCITLLSQSIMACQA